jgi:hypothetical protein
MQFYVPVLSSTGKRLMPTTNRKADRLIFRGRALRRFDRGLFSIQLTDRADGFVQPIAVGIDPGSKREAFTVKSHAHTYLNIQTATPDWVKKAEATSTQMRHTRRSRKTPYRQMRTNRNQGQTRLPPSTRARWGWKLRICQWLARRFPIITFIVEDIAAETQPGKRRWNQSFSPLEVGKTWFEAELVKIASICTRPGYDTKLIRDQLGLKKTRQKLSDSFDAHCVDSWVLANFYTGGHLKPDNTAMMYIVPLRFHRRQLHRLEPAVGGKRAPYGGTISMGFKRGSWVKHPTFGLCYVGGTTGRTVSLHAMQTSARLTKSAKPADLQVLCTSSWRVRNPL